MMAKLTFFSLQGVLVIQMQLDPAAVPSLAAHRMFAQVFFVHSQKPQLVELYNSPLCLSPLLLENTPVQPQAMPASRLGNLSKDLPHYLLLQTLISVTLTTGTKYQQKFPLPLCMPPVATTDNPHLPFLSCLILQSQPPLGQTHTAQPHAMPERTPGKLPQIYHTMCYPRCNFHSCPQHFTKQQRQLNLSPDYVSLWVAKIISFCLPLFSSFNISKHSPLNIPPNRSIKEATLSQHCENPGISWAWWRTHLFPALRRQRQAVF